MGHNLKFKKMEIPEAIKLIQEMKSWMPSDNKNFDKEREAIDTVVSFCEERMQNDKVDFLKSAKQPNQITHPYDLSK